MESREGGGMGSQDTAGSVASQYVSLCTEQTQQAPNMINCQLSLVFITSDKVPAEAIMCFTIRHHADSVSFVTNTVI